MCGLGGVVSVFRRHCCLLFFLFLFAPPCFVSLVPPCDLFLVGSNEEVFNS